jgi:hypothetical protein
MRTEEEIRRAVDHLDGYLKLNNTASAASHSSTHTSALLPICKESTITHSCIAQIFGILVTPLYTKNTKTQDMCLSRLFIAFAGSPELLVYLVVRRCLTVIKLLFEVFVAIVC